jgi:hypothetical protein
MSRVMCVCSPDEVAVLRNALEAAPEAPDLVCCDRAGSVVDEVMSGRPDVLVYGLRPDSDADFAVLWLVNHVAPRLPMVLVGDQAARAHPPGRVRHVHRTPSEADDLRGAVRELLHALEAR